MLVLLGCVLRLSSMSRSTELDEALVSESLDVLYFRLVVDLEYRVDDELLEGRPKVSGRSTTVDWA